jgi:hypothetical protein
MQSDRRQQIGNGREPTTIKCLFFKEQNYILLSAEARIVRYAIIKELGGLAAYLTVLFAYSRAIGAPQPKGGYKNALTFE